MTLGVSLRPILPRGKVFDPAGVADAVDRELQTTFAGNVIRRMSDYPPQETTWGAGQSLGKKFGASKRKRARTGRKGYRRTGRYGRNWRISGRRRGYVEVSDPVEYAVYVGGPKEGPKGGRQARAMGRRGWTRIDTVVAEEWPKSRARIVAIFAASNRRRRA